MAIQDRAATGPLAVPLLSGGGHDECADLPAARPHPLRPLIGLVVGGLVALVTAAARLNGLIQGWAAVGLLTVLMLALPTSRSLSRRILLTGCLLFGWVPVLWWWRLPVGDLGHAGLLLAGTAGVLAGWVAGGPRPLRRLRRLFPRLRIVDAYPLAAGVVTAWMLGTWLSVRSGVTALALLLPGWDNSVHAFMTTMIRHNGVTMTDLPPGPDGSPWAAFNYPQGFHAVCATLIELLNSPQAGNSSVELVRFTRVSAIVVIGVVTLTVAGLCSLPRLRRRPALVLPAATLVTAAYLLGPGVSALDMGQTNFLLAVALVTAAALIAVSMSRPVLPLQLAALGGALVGVAHNWALLLTMAAPAALLPLLPLHRRRWRASPAGYVLAVLVVVATAYGLFRAALIIAKVPAGTAMLSYAGGTISPPLGLVLALALAAAGASVAARRAVPGRGPAMALVPLAGLAALAWVVSVQLQVVQTLQYYFWKFASGVELVALVLLVAAAGTAVAGATRPGLQLGSGLRVGRRIVPRVVAGLASLLAALAATQAFGYVGPNPRALGNSDPHLVGQAVDPDRVSAGEYRYLEWGERAQNPPPLVYRLFQALPVQARHPEANVVYVSFTNLDLASGANADQWYRALTLSWTVRANETDALLNARVTNLPQMTRMAAAVLARDPRNCVVIRPDWADQVRAQLSPNLRTRVLTW